jgi:wobble nucleotide-excising tRNase
MKICRIKEIKNIGTFADFTNGASIGFEKLNFIHGLNTYGKTTLADIFQSLKSNNSEIIEKRKTIPDLSSPQKVNISVIENDKSEKDLIFQNNTWDNNQISEKIEVFTTDFIHNNVFTGLSIDRRNKENLTNFILGNQGVKIAEQIKLNKKSLGEQKRRLKDEIPQYVKNKADIEIDRFIAYDVNTLNKEFIEKELVEKKTLLQKERDRLKEPAKILNLEEPKLFTYPKINFIEAIEAINVLLAKDYSGIKSESILKLNKHIENSFSFSEDSKNWIKQGLDYCKKEKDHIIGCPFCGQNLQDAKELINLYHSYFDESYTDFIKEISVGLKINLNILKNNRINNNVYLHNVLARVSVFKSLINSQDFEDKFNEFEELLKKIDEEAIESDKYSLINLAENKIEEKNKAPYKKVEILNYSSFKRKINEYELLISNCESVIKFFLKLIENFKNQYRNIGDIEKSIQKLIQEIENFEYQKARIEQDRECKEYLKILNLVSELEKKITELEENLKKDQTEFLEQYFNNINTLFSNFGGKNFKLEKEEDNRGHLPVYSLKVKFHNKEITNDQLSTVFSESDRRAMALAIFFAKIKLKDEKEQKETIIILDDPITSFDDNRTTISINYLKDALNKVNQLIILTHYVHFIKRFCEITKKNKINVKFINIKQNNFTSGLEISKREEFIESEYEKIFMKIYDFINKKHSNCIKTDLRPFLESLYFPTVFKKQIQDKNVNCCDLDNIINGLFNNNKTIKNKFHEIRNTLNPDSHIFTSSNIEDIRSFAEDMFNFMYSIELTNISLKSS